MGVSLGRPFALVFILFLVLGLLQRAAPLDSVATVSTGDWGFPCDHLGHPRSGAEEEAAGHGLTLLWVLESTSLGLTSPLRFRLVKKQISSFYEAF